MARTLVPSLLLLAAGVGAAEGGDPERRVLRFAADEHWGVARQFEQIQAPWTVSEGSEGLAVDFTAAGGAVSLALIARWAQERIAIDPAGELALAVTSDRADGLQLGVRLRDRAKRIFVLQPRPLAAGANRLSWQLPAALGKDAPAPGGLVVHELQLVRPAGVAARVVVQGLFQRAPLADATRAVAVRLDAGHPLNVVVPGAEDRLALVLANGLDREVAGSLTWRLSEDEDRPGAPATAAVRIPARGELRLPVALASRALGMRYCDWSLEVDGRRSSGRQRCALFAPVGPGADPAGFRVGVAAHPGRYTPSERTREIAGAALVGVGVLRDDVDWAAVEPRPGEWQWGRTDHIVATCVANGIEPQLILDFGAPHGADPAAVQRSEAHKAKGDKTKAMQALLRGGQADGPWRAFVAATVTRYHERVKLWEVWNEPDLEGFFSGSTDDYLRMLQGAWQEVKRIDPALTVLSGGFAGVGQHAGHKLNPGLQERVLREGSGWFDLHAYHGHGPFAAFQRSVDGELARIRAGMMQPRPLYFNETALTSAFNGERLQAQALVKKLVFARLRGAVGFTWYDLREDGDDPGDGEHRYGMIARDFQPKAVYAAHNELVARLRGKRCTGALDLGLGRWAVGFAGGGERVVVWWNEDGRLPEEPIALRAPGCTAARTVDMYGNLSVAPLRDGLVLAVPGTAPSYVVLPGGEQPVELAARLACFDGAPLLVPGERRTLATLVTNPLSSAMTLGLGTAAPAPLAAGATASLPLELACPPEARWGAVIPVPVTWDAGGGWRTTLAVPITVTGLIPAGGWEGRAPDFRCAAIADVVNFCDADPARVAQTWQGAQDCSFAGWLGRGGGRLRLRLDVSDDRPVQREDADGMWNADSIQVAFQIPGQAGHWEFGIARHEDGRVMKQVFLKPAGRNPDLAQIEAVVTPRAGGMVYELAIPYPVVGLSDAILDQGIRFNVIANDNDGDLREGFVRLAPGIGEQKSAEQFLSVRFAPAR
ncbi:MAG: hypothetical protein L6R48_10055 [Planctomycetes bacterium]|nr:hypothetical protein [Planctomycetota bacterium]